MRALQFDTSALSIACAISGPENGLPVKATGCQDQADEIPHSILLLLREAVRARRCQPSGYLSLNDKFT